MLFNSLQFIIFFPIVTILYFLLLHKYRWFMLLIASCIFYMSFMPIYIVILAITILIDYFAAIWIENSHGKTKKLFLILSIIATCLVLFIFKYFNFFNNSFASIANFFNLNYPIESLNIILPIGLSFHTFQSLSYVIEVYRGNQKCEKNFGVYALFVMFYPQLVAGPIERPQNLLHQFHEKHNFNYKNATDGLKLMTWGMFKKVVIADRLAILVNNVYDSPYQHQGFPLILATIFFAFQIYCDFSGYSDIAIGSAQVMGFRLMKNFNRPYFSKSISEFWKRWHISLSTWFKDYLYISLGGNRVKKYQRQFNLFLTFLVSGLWHGASWTYVIWGAINGFYLIFSLWTEKIREKITNFIKSNKLSSIHKPIQILVTFSLICIAWIFFRAKTFSDSIYILEHLFIGLDIKLFIKTISKFGLSNRDIVIAFSSIFTLLAVDLVQRQGSIRNLLSEKPILIRWTAYYSLVASILFFGVFGKNQFIYFQF